MKREHRTVSRAPSVVVLAAGTSSRFGKTKQIAKIGGLTMVERTLKAIPSRRVQDVVVVIGHEADAIAKTLGDRYPVRMVVNQDYRKGVGTSIRAGVRALPSDSSGALLLLVDQPFITRSLLTRLLKAFEKEGRSDRIVAVSSGGVISPPVVFARRYFRELEALGGDEGARSVIQRHVTKLVLVKIREARTVSDVDTPEELASARRLLQS